MAGRGPQTFKKRQREQQRKEKQAEKLARKLARRHEPEPGTELEQANVEDHVDEDHVEDEKQADCSVTG